MVESYPKLLLSNHPNALRLYPAVFEIRKSCPNVDIVVDALFANFIKPFGFKTVETYSPKKASWSNDPKDVLKINLMLSLGKMLGSYNNAFQGDQVVDEVVKRLKPGRDVLICPSGVTNESVKWRHGIGKILHKLGDDIHLCFVYIPSNFVDETNISRVFTVGSIIPQYQDYSPEKLATELQKQYHLSRG